MPVDSSPDSHSHRDGNAHRDGYCHTDADRHIDAETNRHADADCHIDADTNTYRHSHTNLYACANLRPPNTDEGVLRRLSHFRRSHLRIHAGKSHPRGRRYLGRPRAGESLPG
jgi:hypothetical protein